jgi:hypothetical protein
MSKLCHICQNKYASYQGAICAGPLTCEICGKVFYFWIVYADGRYEGRACVDDIRLGKIKVYE